MLILERAIKNDAPKLAELQKASFDEESKHFNNNEIGGPPGYDSISWQEEMMQICEYLKVLFNGQIIGGALILIESNHVHNLGRIFIDPNFQNQGIGMKVMKEIERSFPDSTKWWLDTPSWSVKNHHFYTKCGFTKVREEGDLYIFEKTL
ncbi:GNAT family N-acetyltransferase [Paenibacillus dendritiformis]|uniref:GNAT family acetyltransferase n=1 Tax=Paenibacillus dendritiformis C454 TaxID=1131935 RepID=H3S9E2_9BACL|nr:GNAT family N-acetyltransferase [Paenibacillus dendritiformis]EHQ64390.1 GNAT family acetyltransferase [Paenibacillus dendritiformis C454]CAH8770394.1 GNAT family N-acetyltransferase [Paenibacillus dendritiformis]